MGQWCSPLDSSINIFVTSRSDIAKEVYVFLYIQLTNLKFISGYVSRVLPQVFLWCDLLQISAGCTFIMKGISPHTHTPRSQQGTLAKMKKITMMLQVLLSCTEKPYITLQLQFLLARWLWPRFFSFALYAVSKLVCVTAALTH